MGYLVELERHLWLNLAHLPNCDKVSLLDAPLTSKGLSRASVGAVREKFRVAQKVLSSLCNLSPRAPVGLDSEQVIPQQNPPLKTKRLGDGLVRWTAGHTECWPALLT